MRNKSSLAINILITNSYSSRNRCVKAKLATWVELPLQSMQAILTPSFTPIPRLRRLIAIRIIDIGIQTSLSTALVEDLPNLITKLVGDLVGCRPIRSVREERRDEKIVCSVGKSRSILAEGFYGLLGVAFEHEERVAEGSGCVCSCLLEKLVYLSLGCGVVGLEIDGEPWVGVSGLLAGCRVERDAGPVC